jgi:hypothetical protein
MADEDLHQGTAENRDGGKPARVRLPGFINDDDIGLGDAVKQVTYVMGLRPCGGCERRAAALNRLLVFSGKSSRRR